MTKKMDSDNTLGLVITDGVGFRNFFLSGFLEEIKSNFQQIIIFSALPSSVFNEFDLSGCVLVHLEDYRESGFNWFFRKTKELAHLKKNAGNNFGFQDNLRANYTESNSRRGKLVRFAYKLSERFNSEESIERFYRLQQKSFANHSSTKTYRKLLSQYKPGLLFFTHQIPPYIAPLLYAAEKEKIKTCSFIFSWDNLASKGRMAGNFNHYLVWSGLMKDELLQFYGRISDKQVQVVGTPQFEPYVMPEYSSTKNEFHNRFELDSELKTICFSCGDVSTSANDPLYIETIAAALIKNEIEESLNFLVRTSPAEEPERFTYLQEKYPFIKWNYPTWTQSRSDHSETWSQRIPSTKDLKDLRMILEFSDLGINMCSTMSLDFMVFDKPVINPVFGSEYNGLYNDQRFLKYAHYKKVVESGAVTIAKDKQELVAGINSYLKKPGLHSPERKSLLRLQIGKSLKGTSAGIAASLKQLSTA